MHPFLELCYLKIYLYYLRCYGYLLVLYLHALMAYIPILRSFIYIKGYVSRVHRDTLFHTRLEIKHLHREWRDFKRKVHQAARDLVFAVALDASMWKIPDAPVPHLLLCNEVPSDTEMGLVKNAIRLAKEDRLRLKAELALSRVTNRDLVWETVTRHKISCVSTFIDQHEGIISPQRRIPPEILQQIFHFAIPTHTRLPRSWNLTSDVPWVLGQVCRSWRESALRYSPLWSCFPKFELRATRSRTMMQLEMTEELLKRSGVAPLCIYVNALTESYHLQNHPTLDLLLKSSERWLVAAFGLPVELSRSLAAVKGRLPHLETLFIHEHIELSAQSLPLDMFRIAPRLRAVNTCAIRHLELPVEHLISCKIEIYSSCFLRQVLDCPSPCPLENLTIMELLDVYDVEPVTLPRLIKLSARFWTSHDTSVLQKLTLPAIEQIRILCCEPNALIANLISMLSKCKDQESTLKRLWYRIPNSEEDGLSDLLALVPNLIELDVNLPQLEHLKHLMNGYMDLNLVPMLEDCKFYVKKDQVEAKTAEVLNDLAESRCEHLNADATVWSDEGKGGSSTFLFPDGVRPLKCLLVYSEDRKAIHSLNGFVNGYDPTPAFESLMFAGIQLVQKMESTRNRSRETKLDSELDIVLDTIEVINVQDGRDVYFSGLHLSLKQLRDWKKLGKEKYAQRAQRILERWEPLFETNWGTRKWVMKGHFCIMYLGRKDPLRKLPRNMEIAYEVKPAMTIFEVMWQRANLRDFP